MNGNQPLRGATTFVGPIRREASGPAWRVTADVDGAPLWFETSDLELTSAPEALASALLIPALHHRRRLRLSDPLDEVWRGNSLRLLAILRRWWGYPSWAPESPAAAGIASAAAAGAPGAGPDAGASDQAPTALFFSGGVDSFHRLLRGSTSVDWLVTLEGFDFPLDDRVRAEAVERSVRTIAAATGKRLALVRTNARAHPLIGDTPWERAHGGVLGGAAHLLGPAATRVLISSSTPGDWDIPYGSHWSLDPLWSSSRTTILYQGSEGRRIDRLRAIAADPLVRGHLRVCWQNRAPVGNCSRCAKCLLAMLILEECGELAHSRVFEGRDELASRIDALSKTPDRYHSFEELGRSPNLNPALAASVKALVRRSRHAVRGDVKLRRRVVGWLFEKLGIPPRRVAGR